MRVYVLVQTQPGPVLKVSGKGPSSWPANIGVYDSLSRAMSHAGEGGPHNWAEEGSMDLDSPCRIRFISRSGQHVIENWIVE